MKRLEKEEKLLSRNHPAQELLMSRDRGTTGEGERGRECVCMCRCVSEYIIYNLTPAFPKTKHKNQKKTKSY